MARRRGGAILWLTGIVLAIVGFVLFGVGAWLVALGGSGYYALTGPGLVICAALLVSRLPAALWVYALILLGTVGWSLYEIGLDWWQYAPRGAVLVLVGLWLLAPWMTRALSADADEARPPSAFRGAGIPLTAAVVVAFAVAAAAIFTRSNDQLGVLPHEAVVDLPDDYLGVPAGEWHAYGRTPFGDRYSPLDQITPGNAIELERAWHYRTGEMRRPGDPAETTYEVTPLKVNDRLYICTPHHLVIALDPTTGEEQWRFDPQVPIDASRQHQTCRGVSYHERPNAPAGQSCKHRVFIPTADARLIALDANTGEVCRDFANEGELNLWQGMPARKEGFYYSTSPPVVTDNLIVVGGAINDNVSVTDPSGVIRAYDVDTGELVWNWDSGNPDETAPIGPNETYTHNSPNSWSIMSVDAELGLVYVPLGTSSPDQWGGNRTPAMERFASSVTALRLDTGQVEWTFQAVHHDIWDMDVPAQPSLLDLQIEGEQVPALVQPTKQGDVFVLDRRSGEPIVPVEEVPAPQGAARGDAAAATQPASQLSFAPDPVEGRDMWGVTMFDQLACRIAFQRLDYRGRWTPPSTQGTLVHPGNFGAFNWGGVAVDPERQVMFGTPSHLGFVHRLIPRDDPDANLVSDGDPGLNENYGAPFAVELSPFLSVLGLPCQAPPWGYVAGANLRTGEIAYQRVNGTVRDLAPLPFPFKMGVPDLGGPVMTAGGVAFISGTLDYYVRAYDVTSGRLVWLDRLPAGGQATPMTYEQDGRQYVVVVAGGHGSLGTKAGDSVIAYALPEENPD
ncbi:MAG: membrane-bound PQQ-dependent dehydrogenase, glucose/quinate/shikimate family [Halofilum sp. (in: g-proteobacteria)]